jgi:hypothetical protein
MKAPTARSILDTVAELVRPIMLMHTHDIRYGAAHDMALLPGSDRMNDDEISAELNHSSSRKKTTRKYKGPHPRDIWSERVQSLAAQPPAYSDVISGYDDPILRPTYVCSAEVMAVLQKDGTMQDRTLDRSDPSIAKAFAAAYTKIKEQRIAARKHRTRTTLPKT